MARNSGSGYMGPGLDDDGGVTERRQQATAVMSSGSNVEVISREL